MLSCGVNLGGIVLLWSCGGNLGTTIFGVVLCYFLLLVVGPAVRPAEIIANTTYMANLCMCPRWGIPPSPGPTPLCVPFGKWQGSWRNPPNSFPPPCHSLYVQSRCCKLFILFCKLYVCLGGSASICPLCRVGWGLCQPFTRRT